ncbi:nitroreductase family protein [Sporosarcina aquimarina]|uniref:nitroreductase family protein n=1 Tax=Sporosarcina aquimarina TaxID=114975 RepID=UPI00204016DB|nr:nitroreductase family protein [Sporosarcina aquimarina]MCM3757226.1 nitroreductase family protein [Sporosarcina aquimarina]
MEFQELIKMRRSANNFLPNVTITEEDLIPIFSDVKLAPSAFNLQHTVYIVVTDNELKEKVREAAFGQYKVHSSSAVIIAIADRYAYKYTESLHQGMVDLGMMSEFELRNTIEDNFTFYEGRGEQFMKEEAIRNASLSSMFFMLSAKNHGWDTCPMIGYNDLQLRELLEVPDTHEIVLMITIGKEKEQSRRLRGYRKPVGEFVKFM